jgi:hypothetical protein
MIQKSRAKNKTAIFLIFCLAFLVSCGDGTRGNLENANTAAPQPPVTPSIVTASVVYRVSGTTDSASLTYINSQGGTVQETITTPWTKTYTMKADDFLYVSAQNQNASGSITSEILINGVTFKTTTSTGSYVIATASGSCCK